MKKYMSPSIKVREVYLPSFMQDIISGTKLNQTENNNASLNPINYDNTGIGDNMEAGAKERGIEWGGDQIW